MLQATGLPTTSASASSSSFARGCIRTRCRRRRSSSGPGSDRLPAGRSRPLSGGEAQRVRFAMAIAGDPDLVFLDEPTVAMDVETRRAFWADMRRSAAEGRTILFATHYLEEADQVADRIVVLDHGRIVADGTGRRDQGARRDRTDPVRPRRRRPEPGSAACLASTDRRHRTATASVLATTRRRRDRPRAAPVRPADPRPRGRRAPTSRTRSSPSRRTARPTATARGAPDDRHHRPPPRRRPDSGPGRVRRAWRSAGPSATAAT